MKKNFAALALTGIIALGSVNVPVMAALSFSDINDAPWEGAKPIIQQVADAGIMVGDYNSAGQRVFRPKDNLSYTEGVQLAYSLLRRNNALKSGDNLSRKWEAVMTGYNIPSWAYESVSYCLENKIVNMDELSKFYKGNTAVSAPREDVCLFFGRALGTLMSVPSSISYDFKDAANISQNAGVYVQLLVDNKVVVGDDNHNFNPKNNMNRSELAVVVSNTDKVLSGIGGNSPANNNQAVKEEAVRGTVTSIGPFGSDYIMSVMSGNENKGFMIDSATVVTDEAGKTISPSSIFEGDEVNVAFRGSLAVRVVKTGASAAAKGHITQINTSQITIQDEGGKQSTYNIAKDANVLINELKSNVNKLAEIYNNEYLNAQLSFDAQGNVILINVSSENSISYGKIKELEKDYISIKKTSGVRSEGNFASKIEFSLDGSDCDFARIEKEFKYTEELYARLYFDTDFKIYRLEASSTKDSKNSVSGTVVSAYGEDDDSKKDNTITITQKDGKRHTYKVTTAKNGDYKFICELDDNSVSLDQLGEAAKLYDITAYLTLNDNEKVYKILATTNETSYDIVIRDIDKDDLKLTSDIKLDERKLEKGSSTIYVYELATGAKYTLNGKTLTIKELIDEVENVGNDYLKASMTIDRKGKVVALDVKNSSSASAKTVNVTLKKANDFNVDDREVTVYEGGKSVTYPLASRDKTYYWVNDISFGSSEDKDDDPAAVSFHSALSEYTDIELTMTVNGSGKVTKLTAKIPNSYLITGQVTSYISGAKYLTIKTSSGDLYTITADSDTQCFYNGKQYSSIISIGGYYESLNEKNSNGQYIHSNRTIRVRAFLTRTPSTEKANLASIVYAEH